MAKPDTNSAEADRLFRFLVESITDYAIYRLDPDGVVTSWNAGAQRVKGYAKEEIVGKNFDVFYTVADRAEDKPMRALKSARLDGRFEDEGWRVRKDGSAFWASVVIDPLRDADGNFIGFAKITRDLSEKRAAFEALRESEHRYRLMVDSVADYAIYTLDLDGRITSWNAGAERTTGYTRDEIIGENFERFFTAPDRARGKPAQILGAARSNGRFEEEGWRLRKDGASFWSSSVLTAMRDLEGKVIGFAKVTRDITAQKSLDDAREQLHQSRKLETVGHLTGGIAHDFNNLLTAVLGSIELIGRLTSDVRIERFLNVARQAGERGARMTHQLLAFSRKQALQPILTNINDLVIAFEALLRGVVSERINFQFDLGEHVLMATVDPAQFQSALLNLVINACDAMPKDGALTISTRKATIDKAAAERLTGIEAGDYAAVEVRDTGVGMSPEVRVRAIEPFFTTKDVGMGSGLGLSQVYGFARQSAGQLILCSEVDRGTSVTIYLPAGEDSQMETVNVAKREIEAGQGTVLVVEDDPNVLEVAVEAVKSFGYEVHSARDAGEALAILNQSVSIDLLFTDVVMPNGVNGVELARSASEIRPDIRVLLASGYPRELLQRNEGFTENMAFIAKPYSLSLLSEKLELVKLTKSFITFQRAESIAELARRDPYAALAELRRRATDSGVDLDMKMSAKLIMRMFDNAGATGSRSETKSISH